MKPLLLIVLLLLANTVAAAEPISVKPQFTEAEVDAMIREAESQGKELDAMQEAEQSRKAAEEQRAEFAKDRYACLMEYRTSAPVIQALPGSSMEAVGMHGMFEEKREARYVRACLESKGWPLIAPNAKSTK